MFIFSFLDLAQSLYLNIIVFMLLKTFQYYPNNLLALIHKYQVSSDLSHNWDNVFTKIKEQHLMTSSVPENIIKSLARMIFWGLWDE